MQNDFAAKMDDDEAGQGLAEYIIIVLLVAVIIIVGLRYFGGSLFGQFQNATDEIKTVGSKTSPGSKESTGEQTSTERPTSSESSGRTGSGGAPEGESASESRGKESTPSSDAKNESDLDQRVAELRTGVGDSSESGVIDRIRIDWSTLGMFAGAVVAIGVFIVFRKSRAQKGSSPKKSKKKGARLFSRGKDENGQVLVIGLFVCVGLMMAAITVANVGMMVAEKIQLQDTVDAAAYSSAVSEARYMNLSAYINRAMIANYDMMAFDTALWAVVDADDHGMAVIVDLLYKIDAVLIAFPFTTGFGVNLDRVIDVLRDDVHHPLHALNHKLNEFFAQDDDADDLNQYIEIYNIDVLTMYQGLLYAAMQTSRHSIQQEVANKMDPEVITTTTLGLAAETMNFAELQKAVDYVIEDPNARGTGFKEFNNAFNDMMGTPADESDNPLLLAATTEASLDRFVAGRTRDGEDDFLRQFNLGHIIDLGALETVLDIECNIEEGVRSASPLALFTSPLNCNADINFILGAAMRDGFEDKHDQEHVPFIARRRMREVNFFGIALKVTGLDGLVGSGVRALFTEFLGEYGHTSGEVNADIGNVANSKFLPPTSRFGESEEYNDFKSCANFLPLPTCGLNAPNILASDTMIPPNPTNAIFPDDHWDGSFEDVEPVFSAELLPIPGKGVPEAVEYLGRLISDGREAGVPKYDWQVDLNNVGIPNYIYPTDGAEARPAGTKGGDKNNLLTGPSIAVIGVKAKEKINGLQGLGIGNQYDMTALARSQVYYVRNPNRPDEVPSLFNPHWVARLAPIDSDDTPVLLEKGLPFISSNGLPLAPTH